MAGGRPTKLTQAAQTQICAAIRAGLTYERAAVAAGVSYDSLNRWKKQGEEDAAAGIQSEFCEFCEALSQAEPEGERARAQIIDQAARGGRKVTEKRVVLKEIVDEQGKRTGMAERTTTTKTSTLLPDWRAAAWVQERRHHEVWGRKDTLKMDVDWRNEAAEAGIDAEQLKAQLVAQLAATLTRGNGEADSGGVGDRSGDS